jgi:hypothetical protein
MNFANPFFRNHPLLRPATVTLAGGTILEVMGIFDRENTINTFGGIAVQNFTPMFICNTNDVAGIDNKATVVVHYGYLLSEDGKRILDEAGNAIIAENEFTYYVKSVSRDANGFAEVVLSKETK